MRRGRLGQRADESSNHNLGPLRDPRSIKKPWPEPSKDSASVTSKDTATTVGTGWSDHGWGATSNLANISTPATDWSTAPVVQPTGWGDAASVTSGAGSERSRDPWKRSAPESALGTAKKANMGASDKTGETQMDLTPSDQPSPEKMKEIEDTMRALAYGIRPPKAVLHEWYQKHMSYSVKKSDKDFVVWKDTSLPPHMSQFTAILCCPIAGEYFVAGRYEKKAKRVDEHGLTWFSQKKFAEHGAAARAHDCLQYRQHLRGTSEMPLIKIGLEDPYVDPIIELPDSVPLEERQELESLRKEVLERKPLGVAGTVGEADEPWMRRPDQYPLMGTHEAEDNNDMTDE